MEIGLDGDLRIVAGWMFGMLLGGIIPILIIRWGR